MSRIVLLGEVNYLIYSPPMKKSLSKIWITLSCFVASGSSLLAADQAAETTSVPEPSAILIGGLCGIFFPALAAQVRGWPVGGTFVSYLHI
ncbi:hypothetical protein N8598_02570 [Akkermansiaceae bacterium]|nr:hypothetical protein [Akkermansiaceae bacterium]